ALLNPDAFSTPAAGQIGNTGRNAFAGPGLFSADLSISRSFALSATNEKRRATIRADFYNALNHANLGQPETFFDVNEPRRSLFGQAFYGRQEKISGFPVLAPLNETARQVQLFLRFEF